MRACSGESAVAGGTAAFGGRVTARVRRRAVGAASPSADGGVSTMRRTTAPDGDTGTTWRTGGSACRGSITMGIIDDVGFGASEPGPLNTTGGGASGGAASTVGRLVTRTSAVTVASRSHARPPTTTAAAAQTRHCVERFGGVGPWPREPVSLSIVGAWDTADAPRTCARPVVASRPSHPLY